MPNTIVGKVLDLGPVEEITTRTGTVMPRRVLRIALRRFDTITGKPSTDFQNTPELVFMGRNTSELCGVGEGDVVAVSFDVSGRQYTDSQGRKRIITDIRPYRLEIRQHRSPSERDSREPSPEEPLQEQEPQALRSQDKRPAEQGRQRQFPANSADYDQLPF